MPRTPDPVSPAFIERLNDTKFELIEDDEETQSPFDAADYEDDDGTADDDATE